MPTEVELRLVAKTEGAVKGIRDLTNETEKLGKAEEKQNTKRKGFIETEEKRLKQLKVMRDKTYNVDNLKFYNQEIERTNQNIKKFEQEGLKKTETGTSKLTQSFIKLGTAIAAAFSVKKVIEWIKVTAQAYDLQIQAERKLLNALEGKERIQKRLIQQAKDIQKVTIFGDEQVVQAQAFLAAQGRTEEQIKKTINAAVQLATVMGSDLMSAVEKLDMTYEGTIGKMGRLDGRLKGLTKEQLINGAAIDIIGEKYKGFAETAATVGLGSVTQLKNAWGDLKEVFGEFWVELLKATGVTDKMKAQFEGTTAVLQDKNIPLYKRWLAFFGVGTKKVLEQVVADTQKANEDLVKTDKEAYDERIAELKKFYETLYGLEEQIKRDLGITKIDRWAMMGLTELDVEAFEKGMKKLEKVREEMDKLIAPNKDIIRKNADQLKLNKSIEEQDLEDRKKRVEAIKQLISELADIASEIIDRSVEDAQRQRELLDTRVAEAQRAMDTEVELYKAGYASNVSAKEAEVERLKKLREQALADEEKALERQRKLDTLTQTSSLITASAETIKAFPGPLLPIAIAIIATMFGAFIAAKAQARNITKLAEGGHGSVKGRLHSEGGEPFLSHVEVEEGEDWGVLNRNATRKYGKVFARMVDSFNKDKLMIPKSPGVKNDIRLDTSATNSRLDILTGEVRKLNNFFEAQEQTSDNGNNIISRKGQTVRIIKRR